jgi:hypothetical protein
MPTVCAHSRVAAFALSLGVSLAYSGPLTITVGVLTPWAPDRIDVFSPQIPAPIIGALGSDAAHAAKQKRRGQRLLDLAHRDHFEPSRQLEAHLEIALREGGYEPLAIPITRHVHGGDVGLRREDLPESPNTQLLLDTTIELVYVVAAENGRPFRPGAIVSVRWLDRHGSPVEPPAVVVFNNDIYHVRGRALGGRFWAQPSQRLNAGSAMPGEGCDFEKVAELEASTLRLWGCFDRGFEELARSITATVPRQ